MAAQRPEHSRNTRNSTRSRWHRAARTHAALAAAVLLATFTGAMHAQTLPASRAGGGVEMGLPAANTDVLEGRTIQRVEIVGNKRTPIEPILNNVRAQEGQLYARSQVEVDIRSLAAMQRFSAVRGDVIPTVGGKVIVRYTVEERPVVNAVELSGNRNLTDETLRDLLVAHAGSTYEQVTIVQDMQAITNAYKKEGYYNVSVQEDKKSWDERGIIRYDITEGPKVRISDVVFQGNEHLTRDYLKWKVQTKPYFWIFQAGKLDQDLLDNDVNIILDLYRSRGYLDVQVSYSLDFSADKSRVTVRFVIIEGTRYRIGAIKVTGTHLYEPDEIMGSISARSGEYADRESLERSKKRIEDKYGHEGYIYREVRVSTAWSTSPGLVDVTFEVVENKAYTVGQVIVRGNQNVQDRVIRRHMRIYPDQTYDSVLVQKSVERLKSLQLFQDVKVSPVVTDNEVADVLVEVQEGQTGKASFGAGVSSNQGLVGSFSLEQRNFDILNTPNSFDEFIHGQSFKGAGQYNQFLLEPGTELQRYRWRFEEPSLFDSPYSFGNDAFFFTRSRESYDEQRIGDVITFGRHFGDVWAVSLAFRAEQVTIKNPQDTNGDGISQANYFLTDINGLPTGPFNDSAQQIIDQRGSHILTSIKPSIIRDTTNSRIFPTEGSRFIFSIEQYGAAGGDITMTKIIARYDWYYSLYEDVFNRKTVFVNRNEVDVIPVGTSVFYERFYGGGIGGLRGFKFRGVSPRQGGLNDPIGGDFSFTSTGEVNFPIYEEMLRGVVFVDVGTVETDINISSIRADAGVGVRVVIPFFGQLPLALDLAIPISKGPHDDTQLISFSLGIPF